MFCGVTNHPGFLSLQYLDLGYTGLSREDVIAISNAVKHGKLPSVRHLDLSWNNLNDCLHSLLPTEPGVHPGYKHLEDLNLCGTMLSSTDIAALSYFARSKRLPRLKSLKLGSNSLTGSTVILFELKNGPVLTSLVELDLSNVCLDKLDIRHLSKALSNPSFSNLKNLHFHGNKLTGLVTELVDAGLPYINTLNLQHTGLSPEDLNSISEAVKCGKLPQLLELFLFYNNLHGMEDIIYNLLKTSRAYFRQQWINIGVTINDTTDPENFKKEMKRVCQGTKVFLIWHQFRESDGACFGAKTGAFFFNSDTVPLSPGSNILPMPDPDYPVSCVIPHPPLPYIPPQGYHYRVKSGMSVMVQLAPSEVNSNLSYTSSGV